MFGITFLVPAFLLGLVAAAIPVLLHLLKRTSAARRDFSAVFLIKRTPVQQTDRLKLRELLLLALRVMALVLLAVAFARPYFTSTLVGVTGGLTVVAVDRSFSMSGPGRFDRARELAVSAVRAENVTREVAVVAFDEGAVLVSEPSLDRQKALTAIAQLSTGWGATRYRLALERAAQVIGDKTGKIIVITDLQRSGWVAGDHGVVPDRILIDVVAIKPPMGNLAVTEIQGGPSSTSASILNGGPVDRDVTARLLVDGSEVDRVAVTVPTRVSAEVSFPVVLPQRGEASVNINDATGYGADDARYLLLSPPKPIGIVLVTASGDSSVESFYLDQALRVGDVAKRFEIVQTAATTLASTLAEADVPPAVVLLLTSRGLDRRGLSALERFTRAGGGVLIVAGPDIEPVMLSGFGGVGSPVPENDDSSSVDRRLVPADGRHPIFQAFGQKLGNLAQVRYGRTRILDPGTDGSVLAHFSDGTAALTEHGLGLGRLLVFGSDFESAWNDFPRHPMFVPFVHETLKHLSGDRNEPRELVVGDGPPESVSRPGFIQLADSLRVAINVDRAESDMARMSVAEFNTEAAKVGSTINAITDNAIDERERDGGYWRYALGLMILALAAESLLGRRTG